MSKSAYLRQLLALPVPGAMEPGFSFLRSPVRQSGGVPCLAMYVVELSLRLTPMPISVQRKELEAAQSLYEEVGRALESGAPKLLDLHCEKDPHKRIRLLTAEVVAVQMFEKSTVGGSGKRPGFSFEG